MICCRNQIQSTGLIGSSTNNTQSVEGDAKPRLLVSCCSKRPFWESSASLMLQYLSKQHEGTTSPHKLTTFLRALPQCSTADHADHPVQGPDLLWSSLTKAALSLRISSNSGAISLKSASPKKQVGKGWKSSKASHPPCWT